MHFFFSFAVSADLCCVKLLSHIVPFNRRHFRRFRRRVFAQHKFNSDNISYFADPDYAGVRMREFDGSGDDGGKILPTRVDVGSYVFGSSIASLTTVRCPPLLADWRPLFAHHLVSSSSSSGDGNDCNDNDGSSRNGRRLEAMEGIHNRYKFGLFDLSREFLAESAARPMNRRSNTMNPSAHTSSVAI